MSRKNEIEFANFVCKFGRYDMSEFLAEIVLPAVFTSREVTSRGKKYLFLDQTVFFHNPKEEGAKATAVLALRFATDGHFQRDNVMEGDSLVPAPLTVPHAGSGIIAIALDTHRLVYLPDTLNPPSLSNFRSACMHVFRSERKEYIKRTAIQRRMDGDRRTMKQLEEQIPSPSLEIVHLAGHEELQKALARFKTLKSVRMVLAPKNAEVDNDPFFASFEEKHKEAGAEKSEIVHFSSKGLNPEATKDELLMAAKQGTLQIKMRGVDEKNASLTVTNEQISFRRQVDIPTNNVGIAAGTMMDQLQSELEQNEIEAPNMPETFTQAIWRGVRRFLGQE